MKAAKSRKAFVTGSFAYGTPNELSDIDLVVLTTLDVVEAVAELEGSPGVAGLVKEKLAGHVSDAGPRSVGMNFGKLNLILVYDKDDFDVWKTGTELLKSVKPVSREHAIKTFRKLRQELGDRRAKENV